MNILHIPVIGICGYSGSGKTTLIAELVRTFQARGLAIAVIKQDAHGLDLDCPGKDTDTLFNAGADVHIQDANQIFFRGHRFDPTLPTLDTRIRQLAHHYDLIFVEGHKQAEIPCKIWLCRERETAPPDEIFGIHTVLSWDAPRHEQGVDIVEKQLSASMQNTHCRAGILFGGKSTRMGSPKHLITESGQTWLKTIVNVLTPHVTEVVLLGSGELPASLRHLPVLPDAAEPVGGPLRGMRTAMRWAPDSSWIFCGCDQPRITHDALQWLFDQRSHSIHAIQPRCAEDALPEPLFAWYDFRAAPALFQISRPRDLATIPRTLTPIIPAHLSPAWQNINSPSQTRTLRKATI
jgi:molybdenum cofactor guanylyltransferase